MSNNSNLFNTAFESFQSGNIQLAIKLCNQIIKKNAGSTEAIKLLGIINLQKGNPHRAVIQFNKVILCNPLDSSAYLNLGKAQYMLGNLDEAVSAYEQVVKHHENFSNAKKLLRSTKNEMKALDDLIDSLEQSNTPPTIKFSDEEIKKRFPYLTTIYKATRLYKHFGYLVIDSLFPKQYINDLHDEFQKDYAQHFKDDDTFDGLKVGDKRVMVSLKLQGLFNQTNFYANPLVMPILARLLDRNFILFSLGAVISLPGAKKQHTHFDHSPLYGDSTIDKLLPSFAITMGIPLIEMNENNGTTRMYGKTHKQGADKYSTEENMQGLNPLIPIGSCMLFDYRVLHKGTANNSENVRPLMYNVYSRAWFRDCQNYKEKKSILVSDAEYKKVPETHRHLLSWINKE